MWFVSLFSWLGKIPEPVKKWGGIILVAAAFAWTFWSFGQADAASKAKVREARALQAQAERYAEEMARVAAVMARASADVSKTETRVVREVSHARQQIEAQPGSRAGIDADTWAAARASLQRLRESGDGGDPASGDLAPGKRR